ncbi:MAG: 4-phosphoerythronate dehydrogenase [Balneolia bacterium]|nr:4-phosphoerythronate dehydrogenase [Balneolia bacterium]
MITLLSDAHIPWLDHLLPESSVRILSYESDAELRDQIAEADALLTRTVTKVNQQTFPSFPEKLRVIGSATAGTDHIDGEWLAQNNIRFFHSPGCNARAVAEYVITVMIHAFKGDINELRKQKTGIIGYGNTGSQLGRILDRIGLSYVAFDPPREARDSSFKSDSWEDVLDCDILSLHVPITRGGKWPTQHMLSAKSIKQSSFRLIVNAARGGVANEADLLAMKQSGKLGFLALDVWENEPDLNHDILNAADIATPHIAGYSQQAKYEASRIACNSIAKTLGFELNTDEPAYEIAPAISASEGLYLALQKHHPLFHLDGLLRNKPEAFSTLRNSFPLRNEFRKTTLTNYLSKDILTIEALKINK